MSLEILLLIVIILIMIYLSFHFARTLLAPSSFENSSGSVCFGNNCFQVEIAKTEAQREKGLMNVNVLDKNKGMLFVFDREGIYPFWMKNTLIPLDIIWIDSRGKIVFIGQNVQPCKSLICPSIVPSAMAKYALEINAGITNDLGIKTGETASITAK